MPAAVSRGHGSDAPGAECRVYKNGEELMTKAQRWQNRPAHENLSLLLSCRDGSRFAGTLDEFSFRGEDLVVIAEFADDTVPRLDIGIEVELQVSGPGIRNGVAVPATLLYLGRSAHGYMCQFRVGLAGQAALVSGIPGLSRREAVRVRPSTGNPALATLRGPGAGESVEAEVQNVSTSGIGVLIPLEREHGLAAEWELVVSLRLGTEANPVDFLGSLRYRRLAGNAILYGIEFDELKTVGFEDKRRAIAEYVRRRQAEEVGRARQPDDRS